MWYFNLKENTFVVVDLLCFMTLKWTNNMMNGNGYLACRVVPFVQWYFLVFLSLDDRAVYTVFYYDKRHKQSFAEINEFILGNKYDRWPDFCKIALIFFCLECSLGCPKKTQCLKNPPPQVFFKI